MQHREKRCAEKALTTFSKKIRGRPAGGPKKLKNESAKG
jgi:hypothetical protein